MRADRLGNLLGIRRLYLKLDSHNWPTYSYKDRVVAAALQRAVDMGVTTVACVSTGNVGNSLAALAAAAGLRAMVFYPSGVEAGKHAMNAAFNADVIQLNGSYDEVSAICRRLALEWESVAFVNITLRPYYAEGAKTVGFEIAEQLDWEQPDHVIVPAAGAALLTRMTYGFEELSELGLTSGGLLPRIHGAQAAGCAPIANAFAAGNLTVRPEIPNTIATSIAIGNPTDGNEALSVIRRSGGSARSVNDQEILAGIELLAEKAGVFTEPAGGAAVALTRKLAAEKVISGDDLVVLVITGCGLKTQELTPPALSRVVQLDADYAAVCAALAHAL
jgi:threonine synthase